MADAPALWERAVTYGAVGATDAPDLLRYPPAGYRPAEHRRRIGHGDERWSFACAELMTWGLHRRSGIEVEAAPAPGGAEEQLFAPDGAAFLRPGDSAVLTIAIGPLRVPAAVRVVYVIDEPGRCGFAYGTLPGHPESGEELFALERTDDGSVWLVIRSLSRPSSWRWRAVRPALRLAQSIVTRRYLRALVVPIPGAKGRRA